MSVENSPQHQNRISEGQHASLQKYINRHVRVIKTGENGFVRSIYQGKLQVFGIPGAPNPSEFDESQVEIIAS